MLVLLVLALVDEDLDVRPEGLGRDREVVRRRIWRGPLGLADGSDAQFPGMDLPDCGRWYQTSTKSCSVRIRFADSRTM